LNAAAGSTLAVSANLGHWDTTDNLNVNTAGSGFVVLSGSNTYSGVTNINGGLLQCSRSTPGARRGVQSNGTTAIIICPCGKVNHPARISKLVMKIL
jgi:autotransporter-associated beta strand protein